MVEKKLLNQHINHIICKGQIWGGFVDGICQCNINIKIKWHAQEESKKM